MTKCQQVKILLAQIKTLKEQLSQEWRIANSDFAKASSDRREWREKRKNRYSQLQATSYQLKAKIEQLESLVPLEIERLLNLKEQYNKRVTTLLKLRLVQELRMANRELRIGITGVDDQTYYLPTYQQLRRELLRNKEQRQILKTKYYQGFTKFLIVPFALSLANFFELTRTNLLRLKREGKLKDTDGRQLKLNKDDPLYTWETYFDADKEADPIKAKLLYYPDRYDQNNHGGKTKLQLLQEWRIANREWSGFQFLLVEDLPNLPEPEEIQTLPNNETIKSNETITNIQRRTQLPSGLSAIAYLKKLQTDLQYAHEQGLAAEDWLALFLTYLEEEHSTIDDWDKDEGGKGKISWLLGTYFPKSSNAGNVYWSRNSRQGGLDRQHANDVG